MAIVFGGIVAAGTLPGRISSVSAIESKTTHGSVDLGRREIAGAMTPHALTTSFESSVARESTRESDDQKRRQIGAASVLAASEMGVAGKITNWHQSSDRVRRQMTAMTTAHLPARPSESGTAVEGAPGRADDRKRRQIGAASVLAASETGVVAKISDNYPSFDHKRRQIAGLRSLARESLLLAEEVEGCLLRQPLAQEYRRSNSYRISRCTTSLLKQLAQENWSGLPRHLLFVQEYRRSIGYSNPRHEYASRDASANGPEESTASLTEVEKINPGESSIIDPTSVKKQASISSAIPKPIRKPKKSYKATPARVSFKNTTSRCSNRIWRCQ